MSGNNEAILRRGLEEFKKKQYDILETKLVKFCGALINKAVDARLLASGAHNFTGNLVNSIIVGLFREGRLVMYVTPDKNAIDRPIMKKMSYPFKYYFAEKGTRSRGKRRGLGLDWDQTSPSSFYSPEMKTNRLWGFTDAKKFINSYRPSGRSVFEIVVGYTAEYAAFVEQKRNTTGYMETVNWIQMNIDSTVNNGK